MVTLRRFTRGDAGILREKQAPDMTDNEASRRLHEKLGFECDGYVYQNAKGREVVLYLKAL